MPSCYTCLGAPQPAPLNVALCGPHGSRYVLAVLGGVEPHPGRVDLGLFEPAAVAPEDIPPAHDPPMDPPEFFEPAPELPAEPDDQDRRVIDG